MHRVAIGEVVTKAQPPQHHQDQGGTAGGWGTLHGLLVSGLQFVRSLLEDEGGE